MGSLNRLGITARSLLLIPALSGCAHTVVDCLDNEASFIDDMITWVNDHTAAIQGNMTELYPHATRNIDDVADELNSARIKCSVMNVDPYALAEANSFTSVIYLNIEDNAPVGPTFSEVVDEYVNSGWNIQNMDPEYAQVYTDVFTHEPAHLTGLDDHTNEAGQEIGAIFNEDLPLEESLVARASVDEPTAWGSAAALVTLGVEF